MSVIEPEVDEGTEDEAPIGSEEVAASAGITYRQLHFWTQQEYLCPEGGGGSGNSFRWPASELEIARRMGRLTAAGLQASVAARLARETWPEGELAPGIHLTVTDTEETE